MQKAKTTNPQHKPIHQQTTHCHHHNTGNPITQPPPPNRQPKTQWWWVSMYDEGEMFDFGFNPIHGIRTDYELIFV